jgi:hypothetical protein
MRTKTNQGVVPLVFVVNHRVAFQTSTDQAFLAKLKENANNSKIVIGGRNHKIQIPQRSRGRPPTSPNKIQLKVGQPSNTKI